MDSQASSGPRVVAVGGGKGGVGKSLVAVNLAVVLARSGIRTVLFDGDFGSGNLHTLLGYRSPGPTLADVVERRVETLANAIVPTDVAGLGLVRGTTATAGAANLGHGQKTRLIRQIRSLSVEVVVIDVGAGIGFNMLDLFGAADLRVLVTTPQITSLENGYGFLKSSVLRELQRKGAALKCEDLLVPLFAGQDTTRLTTCLQEMELGNPILAGALREQLAGFSVALFGNQLLGDGERSRLRGLARMTKDFLGITLPIHGWLRSSRAIHDSVNAGIPFVLRGGPPEAIAAVENLAEALLAQPLHWRTPEDDPEPALALQH